MRRMDAVYTDYIGIFDQHIDGSKILAASLATVNDALEQGIAARTSAEIRAATRNIATGTTALQLTVVTNRVMNNLATVDLGGKK